MDLMSMLPLLMSSLGGSNAGGGINSVLGAMNGGKPDLSSLFGAQSKSNGSPNLGLPELMQLFTGMNGSGFGGGKKRPQGGDMRSGLNGLLSPEMINILLSLKR